MYRAVSAKLVFNFHFYISKLLLLMEFGVAVTSCLEILYETFLWRWNRTVIFSNNFRLREICATGHCTHPTPYRWEEFEIRRFKICPESLIPV
jgi:hypothetical protein